MKTRTYGDMDPIRYSEVLIGYVRDWEICFDLASAPPVEPAMGSIRRKQGATVYGVVYRITCEESWQSLLKTEGLFDEKKNINSYEVIQVKATCYLAGEEENKRQITVWTLMTCAETNPISKELDEYLRPTRRYVNLMIDGANSEGLPAEYVEKLKEIPTAKQWGLSPLVLVMTMCVPVYFMCDSKLGRIVRHPTMKFGFPLFARHEALAWKERKMWNDKVMLWVLKVVMFIVFGVAAIPSVILSLFRPKSRRLLIVLVQLRFTGSRLFPQSRTGNSRLQYGSVDS